MLLVTDGWLIEFLARIFRICSVLKKFSIDKFTFLVFVQTVYFSKKCVHVLFAILKTGGMARSGDTGCALEGMVAVADEESLDGRIVGGIVGRLRLQSVGVNIE